MLEKAWKRPCWPAYVRGLWAACAHLRLGRVFGRVFRCLL